MIDARAVRRLVQLELADVEVPPLVGQAEAALFVRVLVAGNGQLRVELWERGVAYGARVVAGATGSAQLLARRVALAAAELARELSERRRDEAEASALARRVALEHARLARERTLEGPRALRVGVAGSFGRDLSLIGPSLAAELHVHHATRFDAGLGFGFGTTAGPTAVESLALSFGPARRIALTPRWDLDLGLGAEALLIEVPGARVLDGIDGERQTWSARLLGQARLEPRLSRGVRLALGLGGGTLLRSIPISVEGRASRSLFGPFASAELALILTPSAGR